MRFKIDIPSSLPDQNWVERLIIFCAFLCQFYNSLAYQFGENIFRAVLAEAGPEAADRDFKTRLQEFCQARYGRAPTYRLLGESGPDHDKVFEVEILAGKRVLARGRGHSKKEAEQSAAQDALEILK